MAKINSRAKGASGEREFANKLKEYGFEARRGQQFSGANGDPDVVTDIPNIHFEVKRVEKLNIDLALDQSIEDARDGEIPVVAHRKNRTKWKVTLRLDDFITIVKGWLKSEKV